MDLSQRGSPAGRSRSLPSASQRQHRSGGLPHSESCQHQPIEEWLRESLGLQPHQPVSLWSLPDPPPETRPVVGYKLLVALAIHGSSNHRLALQDIYAAIEDRFPYYRNSPEELGRDGRGAGKKWHRSVRHNLSLESIFINEGRPIHEAGKGGYWTISNRNGYGLKRERLGGELSAQDYDHNDGEDDDLEVSYRSPGHRGNGGFTVR